MTSRSRGLVAAVLLTGVLATLPACNGEDSTTTASDTPPATAATNPSTEPSAGATTADKSQGTGQKTGGSTSGGASSCRSLVAAPAIKDAVTGAYQSETQDVPFLHIKPAPGTFFYGQCGTTRYVGTRFELTKGYTEKEAVNMQDEGGAMKYFSIVPGGPWSLIASGDPELSKGCSSVKEIPAELARVWGDCPAR
ncbi:hypothetical protein ACWCQZ_49340 [Streptomyces sp. NPDC002285]